MIHSWLQNIFHEQILPGGEPPVCPTAPTNTLCPCVSILEWKEGTQKWWRGQSNTFLIAREKFERIQQHGEGDIFVKFFFCMCTGIYFLFVSIGWCFGCHNWMNKFFLCHCWVFSTLLWLISCPVIMFGGERQTLILFNCVRLSKRAAERRCNVFNLGHQYPHINLNSMKIKDGKIKHNSD